MPRSKKTMKKEICQGCSAVGMRLLPIEEYLSLYKKLIEDVLDNETTIKTTPLMCRECRSILRSVQKFQEKAKAAYNSLIMKTHPDDKVIQVPHLSTLTNSKQSDNARNNAPKMILAAKTEEVNEEKVHIPSEDVKTEFEYVVEGIKEEKHESDVKIENNIDNESIYGDTEYIDTEETIKEEINEAEDQSKLERNRRRRRIKAMAFNKIDYKSFTKLYTQIAIDEKERQKYLDSARVNPEYLKMNFKCDICVVSYNKRQKYERHLNVYHSPSNTYECELCSSRFSSKMTLMRHLKSHSNKYVCSYCEYERLSKRAMFTHLARAHHIAYECKECGLKFHTKHREFLTHYSAMHRKFVCDYCGFRASSKKRLINHITINHCENICKYCNKRYVVYHSMMRHIALRHTKEVSEESYCVECNMQFDNITLYTRHLKTSVKHKPKIVFPCTACPNVYAKKTAMMNHYKYIHLQKTNYYCDKCSRYFLNGFRLRTHIATYHNNIQAPKNKICSYCGRGFVTNRILDNHIRTHTGERPFACSHCTATFGQKSALVTHTRAIHKIMMRYSTKE